MPCCSAAATNWMGAVQQLTVAIIQGEGISREVVNGKMVMHKRIGMSRLLSVFGAWTGGRGQGAFSTDFIFLY